MNMVYVLYHVEIHLNENIYKLCDAPRGVDELGVNRVRIAKKIIT